MGVRRVSMLVLQYLCIYTVIIYTLLAEHETHNAADGWGVAGSVCVAVGAVRVW